jgi:nucleoside-diphosphate-sugar epimerase
LDRSALSPGLAGRELGWSPQVSLADGVARVLDWFRAHR